MRKLNNNQKLKLAKLYTYLFPITEKPKGKPKCHNCKHASPAFKIGDKTHHQCNHIKHKAGILSGEISAWDTLEEWYNTCDTHEFR